MAETVQQRVAEVLGAHGCSQIAWVDGEAICATCDRVVGHADDPLDEIAAEAAHQAQMLTDTGLLADDDPHAGHRWARAMCPACEEAEDAKAESAPVAGGNGAVAAEQGHPRPTTHATLDSLTARLVAARAATGGYRTEAERLRELLDEAHAKIERMEEL